MPKSRIVTGIVRRVKVYELNTNILVGTGMFIFDNKLKSEVHLFNEDGDGLPEVFYTIDNIDENLVVISRSIQ